MKRPKTSRIRLAGHNVEQRFKLTAQRKDVLNFKSFAQIPVLETVRLRLRGHRIADFDDCAKMWSDAEVTRFIGGRPSSPQQTWGRILGYVGHWALMGFGYWAVEDKSTGEFVGEVGFADYKRDLEPSISGMPEIGWVVIPAMQGKKYASEFVAAVTAWGDESLASDTTACIVNPENSVSVHLAQTAGYLERARTTYNERPTIVYQRPRQRRLL